MLVRVTAHRWDGILDERSSMSPIPPGMTPGVPNATLQSPQRGGTVVNTVTSDLKVDSSLGS